MTACQRAKLIIALELPESVLRDNKPISQDVLDSRDHDLSLAEWETLLLSYSPKEYREPPAPIPKTILTRQARVSLMALRHEQGKALFHPDDLIQREAMENLRVGAHSGHGRNGRCYLEEDLDFEQTA